MAWLLAGPVKLSKSQLCNAIKIGWENDMVHAIDEVCKKIAKAPEFEPSPSSALPNHASQNGRLLGNIPD
jgi:hypothetical protein